MADPGGVVFRRLQRLHRPWLEGDDQGGGHGDIRAQDIGMQFSIEHGPDKTEPATVFADIRDPGYTRCIQRNRKRRRIIHPGCGMRSKHIADRALAEKLDKGLFINLTVVIFGVLDIGGNRMASGPQADLFCKGCGVFADQKKMDLRL